MARGWKLRLGRAKSKLLFFPLNGSFLSSKQRTYSRINWHLRSRSLLSSSYLSSSSLATAAVQSSFFHSQSQVRVRQWSDEYDMRIIQLIWYDTYHIRLSLFWLLLIWLWQSVAPSLGTQNTMDLAAYDRLDQAPLVGRELGRFIRGASDWLGSIGIVVSISRSIVDMGCHSAFTPPPHVTSYLLLPHSHQWSKASTWPTPRSKRP